MGAGGSIFSLANHNRTPIFIGLYHRQPSVGYLVCDSMPDAVMARITKALKIGHIELRAASIDRDDEQSDGLVLSGVAAATQNITGKQFRIQAGHTETQLCATNTLGGIGFFRLAHVYSKFLYSLIHPHLRLIRIQK